MPDLRTLLDDAAAGRPATADPVGAVHARVRRRAARRRAGVAAGTTLAVAAGAAGITSLPRRDRDSLAARPSAAPSVAGTFAPYGWPVDWRLPPLGKGPSDPTYADEFHAVYSLARDNSDDFFAVLVQGSDDEPGWHVTVSFGMDVRVEAWLPRLRAAAGDMPLRTKQCARPTFQYDRYAVELARTAWPSGAKIASGPAPHAVLYDAECTVDVRLDGTELDPRDAAYADAHWGDDVRVYVKPGPSPLQ